ncbi:hypothetical protein TNCV_1694321 [Trichonephila clavipes]|nr:hypothetical protein TNCV_1694321 [Trichonephila clavipes]
MSQTKGVAKRMRGFEVTSWSKKPARIQVSHFTRNTCRSNGHWTPERGDYAGAPPHILTAMCNRLHSQCRFIHYALGEPV